MMEDRYLFRVFNKETKKICPVLMIGFLYGTELNYLQIDTEEGPKEYHDNFDRFILMQSTGLKDKNIYESPSLTAEVEG